VPEDLVLRDSLPYDSEKAIIACEVDEHGKVINPSVASATNPAFGNAAIEAVRQWRFVPRVKDGHPINSQAQVPLDFESL
jgi:TonB family protein